MRHLVFGLVMALLLSTAAIGSGPGATAFITNSGTADLSVIDSATSVLGTPIVVSNATHGVVMDPKGAHAYAASAPGALGAAAAYAIDAKTKHVVGSVTFTTDISAPFGIAVSPDGKRLFMSHVIVRTIGGRRRLLPGFLSVVDVASNADGTVAMSVAGTPLSLGGATTGVAAGPARNGQYNIYVANGDGSIAVLDSATFAATQVFVDSARAVSLIGIAVSPDGSRVYAVGSLRDVSGRLVGKLWAINTALIGSATDPVVAAVTVGDGPFGVAVSPKRERVFVTNSLSNTVSVVDSSTMTEVMGSPVSVGNGPHGVAVTADGAVAYVVNRFNPPSVSVLDGTTGMPTGPRTIGMPMGSNPVAFGPFFSQPQMIEVAIHVVPAVVNSKAQGVVPVIIYGALAKDGAIIFDVHKADPASISMNGWPVKMKGNGEPMINYGDYNGDGVEDMMVHVTRDAPPEIFSAAEGCAATLKGQTAPPDLTPFLGCDKDVRFK